MSAQNEGVFKMTINCIVPYSAENFNKSLISYQNISVISRSRMKHRIY